ncbi:hypothetical protein HanIR_Chr06g0263231 [Helianthus annuus]|nr:hypothetical protein HanIR_Chr06g0263231 [Helianthus annuus]
MRTHEHSRELDVRLPRVHHLLGGEPLQINQSDVNPSLNECKIPAITTPK